MNGPLSPKQTTKNANLPISFFTVLPTRLELLSLFSTKYLDSANRQYSATERGKLPPASFLQYLL